MLGASRGHVINAAAAWHVSCKTHSRTVQSRPTFGPVVLANKCCIFSPIAEILSATGVKSVPG
jgi:hypothetical protein